MNCSASHPINHIVADVLCVDLEWVQPDAVLSEAPGSDSLDIVELQMAIEDSLGIRLPDHEMDGVRTVGQLGDLVERKLVARDNP